MKVLVTGSSGFIGSALVRALAADRVSVAALDRNPSKAIEGLAAAYVCDILDADRLRFYVKEFSPEIIVHLAARADLDGSTIQGYAANVDGVRNLLGAMREAGTVRRAIWTSSQMVCRPGYVPRDQMDYQPHTIYGQSKVLTEKIVREEDSAGLEWCLVRPTTVWGPGMSAHYRRLLHMIARGRYFHVGHGPYFKSYGYIDNVVHEYRQVMRASAEQIHRRTFYLADYEPIDLVAWCDAFQRALGGPPIRHMPRALAITLARCGDAINMAGLRTFPFNSFRLNNVLTEYRFDMSATETICGPLPVNFHEGVAKTAKWFQAL